MTLIAFKEWLAVMRAAGVAAKWSKEEVSTAAKTRNSLVSNKAARKDWDKAVQERQAREEASRQGRDPQAQPSHLSSSSPSTGSGSYTSNAQPVPSSSVKKVERPAGARTGDRSSQVVAGASAIFLEKTASAPVHARQARVVHQEVNVRAPGRGGGGGRGTKRR